MLCCSPPSLYWRHTNLSVLPKCQAVPPHDFALLFPVARKIITFLASGPTNSFLLFKSPFKCYLIKFSYNRPPYLTSTSCYSLYHTLSISILDMICYFICLLTYLFSPSSSLFFKLQEGSYHNYLRQNCSCSA